MKEYAYPKNLHIIKATFHGATNTRGTRFSIESCLFSEREGPKDKITISWDYVFGSTIEVANNWLCSRGFEVVGVGGLDSKSYVFISSTFKSIKQAETEYKALSRRKAGK